MSDLIWVHEWHRRACPEPDERSFGVQLGCHLEEVAEMLAAFGADDYKSMAALMAAIKAVDHLATGLKAGKAKLQIEDRRGLLDSLADQIVTAVGVGHRAGMKPVDALIEVDISNWSKFDERGNPIFDDNGKVTKGPSYRHPNLEGLY